MSILIDELLELRTQNQEINILRRMKLSKYIIKNCPAIVISNFNTHLPYCVDDALNSNCQDCTDCVLKQIVSHCRETINMMCADCGSNPYAMGRDLEARLILQKFDIEDGE